MSKFQRYGNDRPSVPTFSQMRKEQISIPRVRIANTSVRFHYVIDTILEDERVIIDYQVYRLAVSYYVLVRFKSTLINYLAKLMVLYRLNPQHYNHDLNGVIFQGISNCRIKLRDKLIGLHYGGYGVCLDEGFDKRRYHSKIPMNILNKYIKLVTKGLEPLVDEYTAILQRRKARLDKSYRSIE